MGRPHRPGPTIGDGFSARAGLTLLKGDLNGPAQSPPTQDSHLGRLQVFNRRTLPSAARPLGHPPAQSGWRRGASRVCHRAVWKIPELSCAGRRTSPLPPSPRVLRAPAQACKRRWRFTTRAALTLRVRRWLVIERGIPAQARNHGHLALHAGQRQ